jgi:hypothetical protein
MHPPTRTSRRSDTDDIVRYVIVVHGIGQQRKNETVGPVMERMARARNPFRAQMGNPLTLGLLASHLKEAPAGEFTSGLEEGWIELEGIPQHRSDDIVPFVGANQIRRDATSDSSICTGPVPWTTSSRPSENRSPSGRNP